MKDRLESHKDLTFLNTMGVTAHADSFISIRSNSELEEVLADPKFIDIPKLILGSGSNLLFTSDFNGLVIKMDIRGIQVTRENDDYVWVTAGAGENWHDLVVWAIKNNYGGIENLSLIPGTVGAAPMQNIGAYGVEICEVFESLEAIEINTGKTRKFEAKDCDFGYRSSVFKTSLKGKFIIGSVTLRLTRNHHKYNTSYGAIKDTLKSMESNEHSLKSISNAVIHIRKSKLPDPAVIGNAGSFFKNPVIDKIDYEGLRAEFTDIPGYEVDQPGKIKVPAGWLIEQCGWKGKRIGNTGVHKNQALVLVNHGGAKGKEIKALALQIRDSITERFGIVLEPEVNMI